MKAIALRCWSLLACGIARIKISSAKERGGELIVLLEMISLSPHIARAVASSRSSLSF